MGRPRSGPGRPGAKAVALGMDTGIDNGLRGALDRFQRRHRWVGLALAVLYKYADDQGNYLAALLTYYGFLSLFPLLLLAVTILGFVLHGDPRLQQQVLHSALSDFPLIGRQLQTGVRSYSGSGVALIVA